MTHIGNIPHILMNGITHKDSVNANPDYVSIGDQSLISNRKTKEVTIDNGDDDTVDSSTIILGDFTPFYFGLRMPMLYVMQNGGNCVERAYSAEEIVYTVCSVCNLIEFNKEFYFSDGHATDIFTRFFDNTKVQDLPNILDWSSIKSKYWGGDENLTIKRKKQAECLVLDDIPSDRLIGFVCYNENAKSILISYGIEEVKIKVNPKSYY
jgi:hypothetical protein